ncbi:uncharacterized protein ACA1_015560 [Acanthamoeba castellanii str. Neff]|uniref:Transmembrane protein n=1 Tax=Acanthamoeba castellanii (strain ATCC 30010 / Neff) TaxID=1257118 RepID=L8GZQ8_ACACF|nr:uncharacterized protein ACA1_015560 [Acanthamoeba castellanii str. Neff]ELR18734.1 hypothetical protein ACA1_015560 [Acanthamoeba castellanii str. Neff]
MIHRERLYASCNWSALVLALLASILGAIALGTAWYRVEDSSRYTTIYYRWEGVETDAAGVRKSTEYFLLGLDHLYSLTQATLGLTIVGFVLAFALYLAQFFYQVGKVFPSLRLSTSFLTASWVAGVVSTLTYCAAFATYSFWNNAYSRGDTTMCADVHALCSSFIGSSGPVSWGPYVGWAATVVATASVFLSTILFFVGSKKERIVENFEEQLLGNN